MPGLTHRRQGESLYSFKTLYTLGCTDFKKDKGCFNSVNVG